MKLMFNIFLTIFILSQTAHCQLLNTEDLKNQKYYESTLNGMVIRDPHSIEKVLKTTKDLFDMEDEETEVISGDGRQSVKMIFLPGDITNQFSQFKVEYTTNNQRIDLKIDNDEFCTGKGIKLGLTEKEVTNLLGEPHELKYQNQLKVYWYRPEESLYFGNYYFQDNKLIKFWFGFSYP